MCDVKIDSIDPQKHYIKYGNFCIPCTEKINHLARIRPDGSFILADWQYKKLTKRRKLWYKEKLQKYYKSKRVYDSLSRKYQDSI
jgi:hypothetical protein